MTTLTVLETLHKARSLVADGTCPGVFEAVRSLAGEASGLTRDCVYYALLDTVATGGAASLAGLQRTNGAALALFDATIARLAARLH
jgi:hypothetical protein